MARARARRSDPSSSHEAAVRAEKMNAQTQRTKVLMCVRYNPGLTSAEIGEKTGVGRHNTARRLPELRKDGRVRNGDQRICSLKGTKAITWFLQNADGQGRLF